MDLTMDNGKFRDGRVFFFLVNVLKRYLTTGVMVTNNRQNSFQKRLFLNVQKKKKSREVVVFRK
jgi:hypothetical protein